WSGHIWADNWHEGALFSSDGMTIQFDRGSIWQRDLGEPPPAPVPVTRRSAKIAPPAKVVAPNVAPTNKRATAFDGDWSVVIMTQSGGCDRAYRYGVRISNGDVVYDGGGPVDLQGHVFSNGSMRV